ncbi:carboxymuconolactone decarboxylase family protein [Amycolatopsis sp. 195334CR]|uniref:carboxymuconolactone decarboxylase family protein n=1 Tax=Amycolatopsis sp. 195334CR TaxID=2814588 RepID=UPI001A902CBA|nr:carboxymuconolactone decarboxylase family protein [Amycolatopsis sp. 195334CR]MBN6040985.1 carboxymuconolactone decarboxylase family protein [Amycolatopsis sp. 195334CR]
MTAPRVTPGGRAEVGLFAWVFAQVSGRVTGTAPPKLFLTMARRRRLFRGWLRFAARLMPGGTLPRRETELVILRVAQVRGCAYEFEHHRRLGARAGVREDDLHRIQAGPDDPAWTPRERALLHAADALLANRDLDDDTWAALRAHLDEPSAVEFLLLVGHYDMLAMFLETLRITPDSPRR